jgi:hypothetical protein
VEEEEEEEEEEPAASTPAALPRASLVLSPRRLSLVGVWIFFFSF